MKGLKKRLFAIAECLDLEKKYAKLAYEQGGLTRRDLVVLRRKIAREGCEGLRDHNCRSGILLAIPNAIPAHVLAWKHVNRVIQIHYVRSPRPRKIPSTHHYLYVCWDDIKKALAHTPRVKSKGRRDLSDLGDLISAFAFAISLYIKTPRPIYMDQRRRLHLEIERAVIDTIEKWMKEVEAKPSGSSGSSENSVQ